MSRLQKDKSIVAAARNELHTRKSVSKAVRHIVECMDPPLPALVRRSDRVLVKVNLGCTGLRTPEMRFTSHPAYVEAIIECLCDCGAKVAFGDDVSRAAQYQERIWSAAGMLDIASRTGALLVDFVQAGGREVRGFLPCPRKHFITNAALDADVIVNAANCRSLSTVVLSGAIKNMFGSMLGKRKMRLHCMFPHVRDFSRVLVDVYRVVQPRVSFLDLTSVIEAQAISPTIRNVGLMLGSTDPIALDTIAAHAIGYENLTLWTSVYGNAVGLGCNKIDHIEIRGLDWNTFERKRLRPPAPPRTSEDSLYERVTRILNNTILKPRPVIDQQMCTGCGDCRSRCPAGAIDASDANFAINHSVCADCGCCLKVCSAAEAVNLEFVGIARIVRKLEQIMKAGLSHRQHDSEAHA